MKNRLNVRRERENELEGKRLIDQTKIKTDVFCLRQNKRYLELFD